jgi:cellulose synthase/poly-beta-1,6-N-acetylglucosamine synthase-like glycosyltransferase
MLDCMTPFHLMSTASHLSVAARDRERQQRVYVNCGYRRPPIYSFRANLFNGAHDKRRYAYLHARKTAWNISSERMSSLFFLSRREGASWLAFASLPLVHHLAPAYAPPLCLPSLPLPLQLTQNVSVAIILSYSFIPLHEEHH